MNWVTSSVDFEEAVGAAALGVHDALGDTLAVEVLHLLDDVVVVQDGGAARTDGQRVLVAGAGIPESVVVAGGLAGRRRSQGCADRWS